MSESVFESLLRTIADGKCLSAYSAVNELRAIPEGGTPQDMLVQSLWIHLESPESKDMAYAKEKNAEFRKFATTVRSQFEAMKKGVRNELHAALQKRNVKHATLRIRVFERLGKLRPVCIHANVH